MSDALKYYEKIVANFEGTKDVVAGQMFGKACLKVSGKAFIAQHKDTVVFKLIDPELSKAIALPDALLWDPSGKGRPMKEWVALPSTQNKQFKKLSLAAFEYVSSIS